MQWDEPIIKMEKRITAEDVVDAYRKLPPERWSTDPLEMVAAARGHVIEPSIYFLEDCCYALKLDVAYGAGFLYGFDGIPYTRNMIICGLDFARGHRDGRRAREALEKTGIVLPQKPAADDGG
jgi:hypothetical protein